VVAESMQQPPQGHLRSPWRSFFLSTSLVFLVSISILFIGLAASGQKAIEVELDTRARTLFNSIALARQWNAENGGVYVEKKPGLQPSYAKTPDIIAGNGKRYTSKNHAIMTREISDIAERGGMFQFRITSLKPLNPRNAPDAFEAESLRSFELGLREATGKDKKGGSTWYRYMAPLYVEQSCLECHGDQGYRIGDVRGGISVSFNIDRSEREIARGRWIILGLYLLTVLALLAILWRLMVSLHGRLSAAEAGVREMAITDELTGLRNRRYVVDLLTEELSRARRHGRPLSCVIFDVDHFKRVNDTYGHATGDEVLRAISAAAQDECRESDALSRYGGDEFLIVLPETAPDGARVVCERIRQSIARVGIEHEGGRIAVTASFGAVTITPPLGRGIPDAEALLKWADDVLYRAKDAGRNCVSTAA